MSTALEFAFAFVQGELMVLACSPKLISRHGARLIAVSSAFSVVAFVSPGQATAVDASGDVTTRANVSSSGTQANSHSLSRPAISADGRYVAFDTEASNLVLGDTNTAGDVFVRDRQTGGTSRVSVSNTEAQANAYSAAPAISTHGRYVAFASGAANLVSGDTNDKSDIFLRDRQAGTTARVSLSGTGVQGNANSDSAAISANGRYIVFNSDATNLVPGDTNGALDVFLHDRQAGTTRRVSMSSTRAQGNRHSYIYGASVSANGRYVSFQSDATNLVPGDTNDATDVFLRDVQTGATRRISVSGTGEQANNPGPESNGSSESAISADGRYVTFFSFASNLAPNDVNGHDIFLRDWQAGTTRLITVSSTGVQANGYSAFPAISPDGRFVAFHSNATNLVLGDTNGGEDIFVRDWVAGTTRRASVSSTGVQGNSTSVFPAIGSGGRYVTFYSSATNLVPGDTNGLSDIFVRVT